jgi:adenylate cyclase
MPDRILALLDWLADNVDEPDSAQVFGGLCERIRRLGIPLDRAAIQLDNLHPLYFGYCLHWYAGQPGYEVPRSHEFGASAEFQDSPYMAAVRGDGSYRWRQSQEPVPTKPLIRDLQSRGYTDYLTVLLGGRNALPPGVGWATTRPGGFSDDDIFVLQRLSRHLSAPFGLSAERRKLAAVMRTYLGRAPAVAVAQGRVRRGDLMRLEAVVLLTDLRGFSTLAASEPQEAVIGRLDAYAEAVVEAVSQHEGDVLKFVGDGILAIFPIEKETEQSTRIAAAAAAVRQARGSLGDSFVAVLHAGPVAFGNVGARERLDFTVIGEAVNLASRLEAVAKELGVATIATRKVADNLPDRRALGSRQLRGFVEPVELFQL